MSELDWKKAKEHFDNVMDEYKSLLGTPGVNTSFALMITFNPLLTRFNKGERSEELFNEMMEVK